MTFFLDTAQFHEIIDNSPFDSVFEVRVEQREWGPVYEIPYYGSDTYKRFITSADKRPLTRPGVHWAAVAFCIFRPSTSPLPCSGIEVHLMPSIAGTMPFSRPIALHWSADLHRPGLNRTVLFLPVHPKQTPLLATFPLVLSGQSQAFTCRMSPFGRWEGVGLDTIIGLSLEFSFGSYFSPCRLVVENKEPDDAKHSFDLFPNPVKSGVKILQKGRLK